MLESFDNETENGRNCFATISELGDYKNISASRSCNPHFKKYDFERWKEVIDVFAMRLSCFFDKTEIFAYEQYAEMVNPCEIQKIEKREVQKNRVFILSAFPESLVDYFGIKLWKKCVSHTTNRLGKQECKKE